MCPLFFISYKLPHRKQQYRLPYSRASASGSIIVRNNIFLYNLLMTFRTPFIAADTDVLKPEYVIRPRVVSSILCIILSDICLFSIGLFLSALS